MKNGLEVTVRITTLSDEDVHKLCDAIMRQAAEDYRTLRSGGEIPEMPYESIESLTEFFYSDWAKLICRKADPIAIFQRLQRECES